MNDFQKRGRDNRKKRSLQRAQKMWDLYTDPVNPMPIEKIRKIIKNERGKPHTRSSVYQAFKKLEEARGSEVSRTSIDRGNDDISQSSET